MITQSDLAQFTGSERVYRHNLMRTIVYTDGVKYLAEKASAYWLVDKIASLQLKAEVRAEEFQTWKLKLIAAGHRAELTCDDGNGNIVHSEVIDFTDFPLDEVALFYTNSTILLPSEY
ncbi:DUF6876 family protein [Bradyrhizobium sp. S3.7.6]